MARGFTDQEWRAYREAGMMTDIVGLVPPPRPPQPMRARTGCDGCGAALRDRAGACAYCGRSVLPEPDHAPPLGYGTRVDAISPARPPRPPPTPVPSDGTKRSE